MNEIAIRCDGISKQYRIGERQGYKTFRDALAGAAYAPYRRFSSFVRGRVQGSDLPDRSGVVSNLQTPRRPNDFFWALKDVSFEVKRGEVVGIIGRNGAGKSTLLKILSRITEPTCGRAELDGRVGSLLEVGTGFNPELTGRENVYLNGIILGMKKVEVARRFDQIVSFADIGDFIDTPVKRFSSGMYLRLAFAVAAHLETEILLVDEVLAVGDAEFQKRCLGKINEVASQGGRAVLFVTHNMMALQNLCASAIWVRDGKIAASGLTGPIVSEYLKMGNVPRSNWTWEETSDAPGNEYVRIRELRVRPLEDSDDGVIAMQTPFRIEIGFRNSVPGSHLAITLHIYTEQGVLAFGTSSVLAEGSQNYAFPAGCFRAVCHVPGNLMNSGTHRIKLLVVRDQRHIIFEEDDLASFHVFDSAESRGAWYGRLAGAVRPRLEWTIDEYPNG